jgi:hypothetical protein
MTRIITFKDPSNKVFNIAFLILGIIVIFVSCSAYTKVSYFMIGKVFLTFYVSQFLYSQYIQTNVSRITRILNCRLGLIVPAYGFLFLGILILPAYWEFFEVGISFTEGYCIYCFYKMLQFHVGNREEVLNLIESSDYTKPCCSICQKKAPKCCHYVIEICLVQFFTLRPFCFLMAAILEHYFEDGPLVQLLTISTIISLVVAMICLLRSYNFMIHATKSLAPTQKVLFIKLIILLLVIQNLIISWQQETGLFSSNHESLEDS